jgi:hypothetical protein
MEPLEAVFKAASRGPILLVSFINTSQGLFCSQAGICVLIRVNYYFLE